MSSKASDETRIDSSKVTSDARATASEDEARASAGGRVSHTPGPWTPKRGVLHGESQDWWDVIGTDTSPDSGYQYERDVAFCCDAGFQNAEANAHLIAAAPKMLEALKEVAHHADDECGFMVLVRAAILNAKGR